ncbi:NAD(P)H-dependent oxidoreductase [Latilactobacillus sp. VITA-14]|uniref:NAD(P)H-dependent oxidoreductase n=1 Tax=Latilactobacillus sp. VITA-14 TaxID=3367745 RepID=UPI00398298D5
MSKVLVVKAHPLATEQSRTLTILAQFMQVYQKQNPADEISWLDLYQSDLPEIDQELMTAWAALKEGQAMATLSASQQEKVARFNRYTDQFLATDKFVIVNPLWNLNVPTKLKAWIDTVMVAGKTFRHTETAPQPLVTGKKAVHIQSAGSVYAGQDFATQYIKTILGFAGVNEVIKINIEGIDHSPEKANVIMQEAIETAKQTAQVF